MSTQVPMADDAGGTTPEQINLAPGVGENVNQPPVQNVSDAEALKAFQNKIVNDSQNTDVNSIMNAATPTPLAQAAPPTTAETLSNLGKVEPQQLADASAAMTPIAPLSTQGTQAPQVTSVMDQLQPSAPQGAAGAPGAAMPVDPMQKDVSAAYNKQMQANNAIAGAVQAKAAADQAEFKNAEKAYIVAEAERAKTKAAFDTDYNGKMAQYEQSVADFKQAAGDKIVPGQIIADMSTGQKIQSGIFMALSAYGSALSGQENQALKVINNAINMDIDAQKFNIENKLKGARMGVESNQYLVTQMRQKFQDDESATLASRAAMLAMTQQHLNTNASKLDQATAAPKAQALNAQLELQKQQVLQQLKQEQAQQFMLNAATGAKTLTPAQLSQMEAVDKGFRDRWVQGYGSASNLEQAKKFTEYASEVVPAIDGLDRIKALSKDFSKVTDLKKRAAMETEIAGVVGALRIPITGPGILTDSERVMLEKIIGNPSILFSMPSHQKARLDAIYGKLQNDLAKRGHIAGLPEDSFKRSSKSSAFLD